MNSSTERRAHKALEPYGFVKGMYGDVPYKLMYHALTIEQTDYTNAFYIMVDHRSMGEVWIHVDGGIEVRLRLANWLNPKPLSFTLGKLVDYKGRGKPVAVFYSIVPPGSATLPRQESSAGRPYFMTKKEYDANRYQARKDLIKQQSQDYYRAHRRKVIARQIQNNAARAEDLKVYNTIYKRRKYAETPEHYRQRVSQWRKHNRGKMNAFENRRRAEKLRATPPWLTAEHFQQMEAMYIESRRLGQQDGIKRHVDHIYPLRSKLCCGLNVPWNLQILTAKENIAKGNKLPDRRTTI